MGTQFHRIIGYGVGAVGLFTLGLATDRKAEALPFVSQIHALPSPSKTSIFDQRTKGGHVNVRTERCAVHTRVMVRSDLGLKDLQTHYSAHPVREPDGTGLVKGKVRAASQVGDLTPEWQRYRSDPSVFVVDFDAPGADCAQ